MPLSKLVDHTKFQQRLHQLGRSAHQKRESAFNISFGPSNFHFYLSEVKLGGITHVKPDFPVSDKPLVMAVHNHPCKKNDPFDFFSEDEFRTTSFGSIEGLVSVSASAPYLFLLLAWLESPIAPLKLKNTWDTLTQILKREPRRKSENRAEFWMRIAVESLKNAGYNSAALMYPFRHDDLGNYLIMPFPFLSYGELPKFKWGQRFREFEKFYDNSNKKLFDEIISKVEMRESIPYEPEEEDKSKEELHMIHEEAKKTEYDKFFKAPKLRNLLGEKFNIPSLLLAKYLVDRGIIKAFPACPCVDGKDFKNFLGVDYILEEGELERFEKLTLYTLNDISVLLDIPYYLLEQKVESSEIQPDFVVTDRDEKVFVFLQIPSISKPRS